MATQDEIALAVTLLRNAAGFFPGTGDEKPRLREDIEARADAFELVANVVEGAPGGPERSRSGDSEA